MGTHRGLCISQDLSRLLPLLLQLRSERYLGRAESEILDIEGRNLCLEFFNPRAQG